MKRITILALVLAFLCAPLSAQMLYHGGPVLVNGPNVYVIWYGAWGDSDKTVVRDFLKSLTGSAWFAGTSKYYDSTGAYVQNKVNLLGEASDNYSQGISFPASATVTIVQQTINIGALPLDPKGVYAILGSPDSINSYGSGYHWGITINGVDTQLLWSRSNYPTSTSNTGQSVIPILTHELVEAVTDPHGFGWYDSAGEECADKCGTYSTISLGGKSYRVADYYLVTGGCNGSGSGGGTTTPPPTSSCPPGTRRLGNSGKCK